MKNKIESAHTNCGEFLRHANFCEALAADLAEPVDRAALGEMAERWRELAISARREANAAATHTNGRKHKPARPSHH